MLLGTWEIIAICAMLATAAAIGLIFVLTRQRRLQHGLGGYPYNHFAPSQWPQGAPHDNFSPHEPGLAAPPQEPGGPDPRP